MSITEKEVEYRQYQRTQIAEMADWTPDDDDQHRNEPPPRDYYQEKLDRWKDEWNRALDDDLANGR